MRNANEIIGGLEELQHIRLRNQCYACMGNVLQTRNIIFVDDLISETIEFIKKQQKRIEELGAAQTARVLTLEEMQQWEIKTIWDKNAVYVENVSDPGYLSAYDGRDFDVNLDGYGISWRCWTQRPTDEQREAEAWN